MEVVKEQIYIQYLVWGPIVLAGCGLAAWMHWSWTDEIVLGFKIIEELYPSLQLGVDSVDTSQMQKNWHGQFQYF